MIDETNKIYAEQLRECGIEIPEDIPDCAWIPRGSMHLSLGEVVVDKDDPTKFNVRMEAEFTEPFRWVEGKYTVTNA